MSCQRADGHRSHINGRRGHKKYLAQRKNRLVREAKEMEKKYASKRKTELVR